MYSILLTARKKRKRMSGKQIVIVGEHSGINKVNDTSDFTIMFQPPIPLESGLQYEVAVTSLQTYASWYNISAAIGNNKFSYYNGTAWKYDNVLPDSNVNSSAFNQLIHDVLVSNGDYTVDPTTHAFLFDIDFVAVESDGHMELGLSNGYKVDFSRGDSLYQLLGFSNIIYTASASSPNPSDFLLDNTTIMVRCSLVSGSSYQNGNLSDIIYTFSGNQAPYALIDKAPFPSYQPLNARGSIDRCQISLVNQDMQRVSLNNYAFTMICFIRPIVAGR